MSNDSDEWPCVLPFGRQVRLKAGNEIDIAIGSRLRELNNQNNVDFSLIALRCGISTDQYRQIENGKLRAPPVLLARISDEAGIKMAEIFSVLSTPAVPKQ